MNCTDISRILDERELAGLTAAERGALDAHVAACRDCAAQLSADRSLAALRTVIPPLPTALAERARELAALDEVRTAPQRSRRPILLGSLFLLGSAATMLGAVGWRELEPGEAAGRQPAPG